MTTGVCPVCLSKINIVSAINDAEARKAVAAALKLPGTAGDRVLRYIQFFNPKSRSLSWDRFTRLLTELTDCISKATVHRNGRDWAAPQQYWIDALDDMLARVNKLDLPLKDHAYLFEIVANRSNKAEGKRERKREEQNHGKGRRTGETTQIDKVVSRAGFGKGLNDVKTALKKGGNSGNT